MSTTKSFSHLLSLFALFTLPAVLADNVDSSQRSPYVRLINEKRLQTFSAIKTGNNTYEQVQILQGYNKYIDNGNIGPFEHVFPLIKSLDKLGYKNFRVKTKHMKTGEIKEMDIFPCDVYNNVSDGAFSCFNCKRYLYKEEGYYFYLYRNDYVSSRNLCLHCVYFQLEQKKWGLISPLVATWIDIISTKKVSTDVIKMISKYATPVPTIDLKPIFTIDWPSNDNTVLCTDLIKQ